MGIFKKQVKTNKSSKFMVSQINKIGFSKIFFNLNKRKVYSLNLMEQIVIKIFKRFRKNRSFYLLAKFIFIDNSVKTLHKGIVVTKEQNLDYFTFLKLRLEQKDKTYDETLIKNIVFEYYFVPKSNLSNYSLSWPQEITEMNEVLVKKY